MSDEKLTPYGTIEFGEICPNCDNEETCIVDYEGFLRMLKGMKGANLPLIHCSECGNRLTPCSLCTDAINDGIITEEERNCSDCPITKHWDAKYGEDKHGEEEMTDLHGDDPMTTTDEKKTPTLDLDEIKHSFYKKCHCNSDNNWKLDDCTPCDYHCFGGGGCDECDGGGDSQGECLNHYIYDVLTDARDINKPLWNPPKEELPSWCKVGAWVMDEDDLTLINEIDHAYIWGKVADRDVTMMQPVDRARELKPVKFRPYNYEEAQKLIGKLLEIPEIDGFGGIDLICSVSYDRESGDVLVNGESFKSHSKDGCLINGRPFGVPVVDEEAMKEGEE